MDCGKLKISTPDIPDCHPGHYHCTHASTCMSFGKYLVWDWDDIYTQRVWESSYLSFTCQTHSISVPFFIKLAEYTPCHCGNQTGGCVHGTDRLWRQRDRDRPYPNLHPETWSGQLLVINGGVWWIMLLILHLYPRWRVDIIRSPFLPIGVNSANSHETTTKFLVQHCFSASDYFWNSDIDWQWRRPAPCPHLKIKAFQVVASEKSFINHSTEHWHSN